jgi:hypothetical protein
MEEFDCEEDTSLIQNFLSQYSQLKTTGTPCKITEARKWYATVANEAQSMLNTALGMYFINMQQKLPHSKLGDEDLETIVDDGELVTEYVKIFNTTVQVVHELYKNPNKYVAWKGEITLEKEVEGIVEKSTDVAYYFEPKPEKENLPEAMYI